MTWLGKLDWVQGCLSGGKRSPIAFRSRKGATVSTAAAVGWYYPYFIRKLRKEEKNKGIKHEF